MHKYMLNKMNEEHVWKIFEEQNTNTKCCHTKKKKVETFQNSYDDTSVSCET